MGEMTVSTRSIMPCLNHAYVDQVGVICHSIEATADKRVDSGREMMTISDEKAALFNLYFS